MIVCAADGTGTAEGCRNGGAGRSLRLARRSAVRPALRRPPRRSDKRYDRRPEREPADASSGRVYPSDSVESPQAPPTNKQQSADSQLERNIRAIFSAFKQALFRSPLRSSLADRSTQRSLRIYYYRRRCRSIHLRLTERGARDDDDGLKRSQHRRLLPPHISSHP